MTGPEASPGFDAADRALLDSYTVPPPSPELVDRIVLAALHDGSAPPAPPLPRLRKPGWPARWRNGVRLIVATSALGIVTAAAAERGVFGPEVQESVQGVVARVISRDAPAPSAPAPKAKPTPQPAPDSSAMPSAMPAKDPRVAPLVERLRTDPQVGDRVERFMQRRAERQTALGQTPAPPDIAELARRYRQLPPERKRELRRILSTLPPEEQAEIRAIIRDYRATRKPSGATTPNEQGDSSLPR